MNPTDALAALFLAHLVGDYVVQNDWMAANKTSPKPLLMSWVKAALASPTDGREQFWGKGINDDVTRYKDRLRSWWIGHVACTVHCLAYTFAVWLFSFTWMPWWGLIACFAAHWPVDRFRLAHWWMVNVSGQKAFATGPLAPWSVVMVDNVFHLLTLYGIWLLAGVMS